MVLLRYNEPADPVAIAFSVLVAIVVVTFWVLKAKGLINEVTLPRFLRNLRLDPAQTAILDRYFYYYYNMPDEKLKAAFRYRVAFFIKIKDFIPMGGLAFVNDEMKVLIAASATQMAFGYPDVYFMHFRRIYVFPAEFVLPQSTDTYEGKVNLKGGIVISWRNFLTGYKFPEDGRNLGLHEMAHAMYFENAVRNDEYNFLDRRALVKYALLAKKEMQQMESGYSRFFRDYATRNRHEFFAVAVESFFERAVEFRGHNAELYKALAELLNQDPAEKIYILKKKSARTFFNAVVYRPEWMG
jgi:hypothetical protein